MTNVNGSRAMTWGAASLLAVMVSAVIVLPAAAQVTNGGFEDGDLNGWTTGGGAAVEVLQAGDFSNPVTPTEGSFFALLSTGPGDGPGPGGDFDANGTGDFDSSTLSVTFDVAAAPASLSFDWAFLSAEFNQDDVFDDVVLVTLDGTAILTRSVNKPGGISPFPDTLPTDAVSYTVASAGATNGSAFTEGRAPFQTLCFRVETAGTHTLTFLVADQGDSLFDSGLLVDNFQVPSTCDGSVVQLTNTTGATLEVKGGALDFQVQDNREVAASDDGSVVAFVSNGDHASDNPNLQTQIFVAAGGVFERVTAMTGAVASDPALTSNGRFLTFAATGDLTPGSPGNADGNLEVFRWDRILGVMTQVTNTTGCDNRNPTVSHNSEGRRIAFATTCTDLTPGFNADGSSEVVIWDAQTGAFQTRETTGCTNRSPVISQHDAGQYASFVSNCNFTGGNGDGNFEIFQWNRVSNAVTQVTSTSSGNANDSPSSSVDGSFVSFVSSANLTGANADQNLEVFRWSRAGGTTQQLTFTTTMLHLATSIDDSGRFVAFDRVDLFTGLTEAGTVDATTLAEDLVTPGASLPAVAAVSGTPRMAFQASGDFSANNGDGNQEVWLALSGFSPSDPDVFCSTVNLAIPNNSPPGLSSSQTIASAKTIADLDVFVRITHPAVRDLVVTLVHVETGTSVTLIDQPGLPPGAGGCNRDNVAAILDDEAASPVENECVAQATTIFGTFSPNQLLAAFDGEGYDGTWTLNVADVRNGNTGTLNEWCLLFTP